MENEKSRTTKEKILIAARSLFVKYGYAGTSMGKIGKHAGVTHSLMFHHFGNKENLWVAVKQMIASEAEKNRPSIPDTELLLEEFLMKAMQNIIMFYQQNPDIIRLIQWQRLESMQEKEIAITESESMQQWINAIENYKKTKKINTLIPTEFILGLFFATALSFVVDNNKYINSKEKQNAYIKYVVDTIYKSL